MVPRNGTPLWQLLAPQYRGPADQATRQRIRLAWDSEAMRAQRERLESLGLSVDPDPALWKYLPGPYLRLFFRVSGASPAIEEGQVVAVVLLHDPTSERTLYAHPVHAGPHANPLLKHLFGPMAGPKSQEGRQRRARNAAASGAQTRDLGPLSLRASQARPRRGRPALA